MERKGINNMTKSYFQKAAGVILVFDAGDRRTLYALEEWIWRSWESQFGREGIVLSLWSNTATERVVDTVSREDALGFAQKYSIPENLVFEVSTLTGERDTIERSFREVLNAVGMKRKPGELQVSLYLHQQMPKQIMQMGEEPQPEPHNRQRSCCTLF